MKRSHIIPCRYIMPDTGGWAPAYGARSFSFSPLIIRHRVILGARDQQAFLCHKLHDGASSFFPVPIASDVNNVLNILMALLSPIIASAVRSIL